MKKIREYNLREIANAVEATEILSPAIASRLCELHDLTRWIPVSERLPTQEDGDVLAWYATKYPFATLVNWYEFPLNNNSVTHWKRITPPEGK
jgi:hypothetical protein